MIYLVEKYGLLALESEILKGLRLLAMCGSSEPIPTNQNQRLIIDFFNSLAGNKMILCESLLFLEDKVTTLYNEINL